MKGRKYYYLARGANIFCWVMLLRKLCHFRILGTILWSIPAAITHFAARTIKDHQKEFVVKIELKDNGTQSVVTYMSGDAKAYDNSRFSYK